MESNDNDVFDEGRRHFDTLVAALPEKANAASLAIGASMLLAAIILNNEKQLRKPLLESTIDLIRKVYESETTARKYSNVKQASWVPRPRNTPGRYRRH